MSRIAASSSTTMITFACGPGFALGCGSGPAGEAVGGAVGARGGCAVWDRAATGGGWAPGDPVGATRGGGGGPFGNGGTRGGPPTLGPTGIGGLAPAAWGL